MDPSQRCGTVFQCCWHQSHLLNRLPLCSCTVKKTHPSVTRDAPLSCRSSTVPNFHHCPSLYIFLKCQPATMFCGRIHILSQCSEYKCWKQGEKSFSYFAAFSLNNAYLTTIKAYWNLSYFSFDRATASFH